MQPPTFPNAKLAYEAWSAAEQGPATKRSAANDHMAGLEVRETFRKLRNHFQLFGFLTDATLEGFVAKVLVPNICMEGSADLAPAPAPRCVAP